MTRRIAVVTGGRPDYGLLRWLLQELHESPRCELQLIATGMHLVEEFGRTIDEIRADGLPVAAEVPMLMEGDSPLAAAHSTARGVAGCADAFDRLQPDLIVLLGDRFEILAAAQAAMMLGVPIAHIHGGEITEGSMDEFIRHAITKLSSLHFVSAEAFRNRLLRMGELPDRVFTVGAIGLDHFVRTALPSREQLLDELKLRADLPFFVATYHAATRSGGDPVAGVTAMLAALDRHSDHQVVFTHANADPGGYAINDALRRYVDGRADGGARLVASLGSRAYLAALKHAAAVVGNSSSGLIEAPAVGTPTVNIGSRQKGRPRAATVIDCDESESAIAAAIARAIDPATRRMATTEPPYGRPGNAAAQITRVLLEADLAQLRTKPFYDGSAS